MTKSVRLVLAAGAAVLLVATSVRAATITINVIDTTTIHVGFSGTLGAGTPSQFAGTLFIPGSIGTSPQSHSTSIAGTLNVGADMIGLAHSKIDDDWVYGSHLQLRNSLGFNTAFTAGSQLTGQATITFDVDHGLTQSVFDGGGAPVYWGKGNIFTAGSLVGRAISPTPVPVPAGFPLLLGGLAALGFAASRRRAS